MQHSNFGNISANQVISQEMGPSDSEISVIDSVLTVIRRQLVLVLSCCVIGTVLSAGLLYLATPLYTADGYVLIDKNRLNRSSSDSQPAELPFDNSTVESQVEILRSEKIAHEVIDKLDLENNTEFNRLSAFQRIWFRWFPGGRGASVADNEKWAADQNAFKLFQKRLDVRRVGRTYVLHLQFQSSSPARAASVVNAVVDAYLKDQLDARFDVTRRATNWMQDRIDELKQKTLDADRAVETFRGSHGLVQSNGKFVNEQQLGEINTQLISAQAEVARNEARFKRIESIIKSKNPSQAVSEALENPSISNLRAKYFEASKQQAYLSNLLGPDHIATTNLKNEMNQYELLIFDELKRISESYQSDLQISKSKEQALSKSLSEIVGAAAADNSTLVELRELERSSESYRSLLQNFLARYQTSIQDQSFPIIEARILSSARVPDLPSYPSGLTFAGLGALAGALMGFGLAAAREFWDNTFRTVQQVREKLGLPFLGSIPLLNVGARSTVRDAPQKSDENGAFKSLDKIPALMRHVLDSPLSSFSETIRSIKVTSDIALKSKRPKVVGIVSVLPGEGKSTVAKNLASLIAKNGQPTLLVDGDLRNPGLTRSIAPLATQGLVQFLSGTLSLKEAALIEDLSKLLVLPAPSKMHVDHASELLCSEPMRSLLTDPKSSFEYIIVDLPPIGPVIDVKAMAHLFDSFIFVIEWGKTPRALVQTVLDHESEVREKCAGVVFNKVDSHVVKLYQSYNSKDYFHSRYKNYYRN